MFDNRFQSGRIDREMLFSEDGAFCPDWTTVSREDSEREELDLILKRFFKEKFSFE